MREITKVSEIQINDLIDYLRIYDFDENDVNLLKNMLTVAKTFIQGYTGHTAEELDNYSDFVIVVFVLVQDMWDNRTLYVDKSNLNTVVDTILGMHSVNLL